MEDASKLIDSITNLINSLNEFVQNNGTIVLFGVLGFGLAYYIVYTVGKLGIKMYETEIERVVSSRNRVHEALLESRESSKKKEEREKNDRD